MHTSYRNVFHKDLPEQVERHKLRWVSELSTSSILNKENKPQESADDEKTKKKAFKKVISEEQKQLAKDKLRNLLLEAKSFNETTEPEKVKVIQSGRSKPLRQRKVTLDERLKKSAAEIAEKLGGDVEDTTAQLLNPLQKIQHQTPPKAKPSENLTKTEPVPKNVYKKMSSILMEIEKIQIQEPSGIGLKLNINFPKEEEDKVDLKLWNELEKKELNNLVRHSPRNYFEELILWTEQGKLWHFPIDNDQGMEDEAKIDFTEHVFLEEHLEPWCPKAGPLRYFMDLVLVGLSKNPYLTVEDKKEHIYWYRDYFESKKKLLLELGAFADTKQVKELPESNQHT